MRDGQGASGLHGQGDGHGGQREHGATPAQARPGAWRGAGHPGQFGGLALVITGFRGRGTAGQPVRGRLPVRRRQLGAQAGLGQLSVQGASRPTVYGKLVAGADHEQPGRLAFGDGTGPGAERLGRHRHPEHRRADQQGPGRGAEPAEQVAEHQVAGHRGDLLGGCLGELGGFGPRHVRPGRDRGLDPAGQVLVALAPGQEQVEILHGQRVARGQPPHLVAFGVAEEPDRGQRRGELVGARAGQRA